MIVLWPGAAHAWGPVTHVALGVRAIATVISPDHPVQATLANFPEVFLYGSLAPDIVQGRRLQSRLRRHSHNWSTARSLISAASDPEQQAFALGYLAHLGADVIAHNFYLPAHFVGNFESRIASHIYAEARFDTLQDGDFHRILLSLLDSDFSRLDAMLDRAVDSPLVPFNAHRRIFDGGLRRIQQWNAIVKTVGPTAPEEVSGAQVFTESSCCAIRGVIDDPEHAPACRFDPMGTDAVRSALASRRNLQRLTRVSISARETARELAATMVRDVRAHLQTGPFGAGDPKAMG